MNPIALRLLHQQLIVPQFKTPAEVVSHMGAIQAQEYRMMRWAVEMRTKKPSHKAFKEAYDSGQIIRLHLMRGTWQLVSAEDYWWMLDLCAPKAIAVTKGWMSSNKISIPDEELHCVRDILTQTAADRGSATKGDFVKALTENNMQMDDHRLSYHIRMAEFDGVLCSGDLLPTKATYTLSAEKVGARPTQIDRDKALMRLTRKYFQSHQPATLEDFVWWSGLNVNDCRKGIALLGDTIHKERLRVGDGTSGMQGKLFQFDRLAINVIVENSKGDISSCDIPYSDDLQQFNHDYQKLTAQTASECKSNFLDDHMIIGTSTLVQTEIDCIVNQYSGQFNNPFLAWARYRKGWFKTTLPISFQFHHVQMDGGQAAKFLANLQNTLNEL